MALSVAARCDPGLGHHALVKLDAPRAEVQDMLGMGVRMGGCPALMHAAKARQSFRGFGGAPAAWISRRHPASTGLRTPLARVLSGRA